MHGREHRRPDSEATLAVPGPRYRANLLIHKLRQHARVLTTGTHTCSVNMSGRHPSNLFLEIAPEPFPVIQWKHILSAIHMPDVIPGDGTRFVGKGESGEAAR